MKTQRNIFIAFILNMCFSLFEIIGGLFTGSVAIISDAVHDLGDAVSIGLSLYFEKKSRKQPDENIRMDICAILFWVVLLLPTFFFWDLLLFWLMLWRGFLLHGTLISTE